MLCLYLSTAQDALVAMAEKAAAVLEFGERAVAEENTAEARIARCLPSSLTERISRGWRRRRAGVSG